MNNLPTDDRGHVLQAFSPDEVMLAQTSIDTTDKEWAALMPADPCKIKIDGTASFVTWPYGCVLGLSNINTVEFEAATDVYAQR